MPDNKESQNALDKSDEQISDDDLDDLVNSLNRSNNLLDTNFEDSFTKGYVKDDDFENPSADALFMGDTETEDDNSDNPNSLDEAEESQSDKDEIDLLLNSMPATSLGTATDESPENGDSSSEDENSDDESKKQSKKKKSKDKPQKEKKPPFDISKVKFVGIIFVFFKKVFGKLSSGGNAAAQKIPTKVMYIVLGVMVTFSVVFGILLYTSLNRLNTIKAEKAENLMRVSNDIQASTNSSNFIYTALSDQWNGWDLIMKKMLLDSEASMFYFDRLMDMNNIDVTLTDDTGKLYGVDAAYYSDTLTNQTRPVDVLRFQPLPAGTKKFTVYIYDLTSKDAATFLIELKNPLQYTPVKYLEEPMEVELYDEGIKFYIEDAVFASSGTTITYKLERFNSNSSMTFADLDYISSKSISVVGGGKNALAINNFPTQHTFSSENMTIGRMTFNPLVSLNGFATISFRNMYKRIEKETVVEAVDLFSGKEESQETISAAPYKIVLERMSFTDGMYVLVYHAENVSIVQKQMDESISIAQAAEGAANVKSTKSDEPRKLPAKLSATLLVELEEGGTIEIEGSNVYSGTGGEVRFSTANVEGLPSYILRKSLSIKVKDISFQMPDASVKIDLTALKAIRSSTPSSLVTDFLTKAFDDRLKIKSGEQDSSVLTEYLTDNVISNAQLSEAYAPLAVEGSAQHTAQVITLAKRNDKKYLAVVGVTWNGIVDGREIHFYRTHKLIVEYLSNGWRITHDEII